MGFWNWFILLPSGSENPILARQNPYGSWNALAKTFSSIQFSSFTQSCPTLCDPMDCSTPGFTVYHQLLELTQAHVHWVSDTIQPSYPLVIPFSFCLQSFPVSGSFPMSRLFTSGGQSIIASASSLVLPMSIQSWFPLGLTGLISLQSKELLRNWWCTKLILCIWHLKGTRERITVTMEWFYFAKWCLCVEDSS